MGLNTFAAIIIMEGTAYHPNKEQVLCKVMFFKYCLDITDTEQELIEDHIMEPDTSLYLANY